MVHFGTLYIWYTPVGTLRTFVGTPSTGSFLGQWDHSHEWTKVIFVPLPKAGDLKECKNYRNVSLICHASRVMLCTILDQLRQYSERELPEEQAGFRVGRGTRDMLFILQLVIEKTLELEEK